MLQNRLFYASPLQGQQSFHYVTARITVNGFRAFRQRVDQYPRQGTSCLSGPSVNSVTDSFFRHCAQIVQSLVPRAQSVGVLGPSWDLVWTSGSQARNEIAAAMTGLAGPPRVPATADEPGVATAAGGSSVHFLWLRNHHGAIVGILAISSPGQPSRKKADSLAKVSQRVAPVLALLAEMLASLRNSTRASTPSETSEFAGLHDASHIKDGEDLAVDDIDSLIAAFHRHANCDATLLMVPAWHVDRCIGSKELPVAQSHALTALANDYLWPEVRSKGTTVILNRARFEGVQDRIPFRVMGTPIKHRSTVLGVLIAYRPSEAAPFESADILLHAKLASRLLELIEVSCDKVTGLLSRQAFEKAVARRLMHGPKIARCLIYGDIDQLHMINDLFGFACGDRVLSGVARCWEGSGMPEGSLVSRLGGDRFVAQLENCTLNQARAWADQLRGAIEHLPALDAGTGVQITMSIGVAAMADDVTLDHGLAAAESACKAAKDRGRNRVELFSASDESLVRRYDDLGVFRTVVEALDAGRFMLFAQPIVPLKDRRRPTSYELLVRMKAPDGHALSPRTFFSAASRYQFLPKLDRWVLSQMLSELQPYVEQLESWKVSFSINVSGQSLGDSEFADFARSKLKSSGIPPRWIALEITESAAIGNFAIAKRFISRMTALGCRFSLDDFGTGLSSLAYLKELAVSTVKIDGVFVRDLLSNSSSDAMIEAVMTIAHELQLDTVAEFVESEAVYERLLAIGVTHGQGYVFGRPQPLAVVLNSLAAEHAPRPDISRQAGQS